MGKSVSLFPRYSQGENRTTNYFLLILRMIYEESPRTLSELLSTLLSDESAVAVGVGFVQQERRSTSVPDGFISQTGFSIYVETKAGAAFDANQLKRHLASLAKETAANKVMLALGNIDHDDEKCLRKVAEDCREAYGETIRFSSLTFKDLVAALRELKLDARLAAFVSEFETYLAEENLLPLWMSRLDVVNCSGRPEEVLAGGVYMCPAQAGAYSHKRARFFGMYQGKSVRMVAEIEAVIEVASNDEASTVYRNSSAPEPELLARAVAARRTYRPGAASIRVFLLGTLHPTDFTKDTKGGMQGSKRYFDVESGNLSSAADLALFLRGKRWSELEDSVP